MKHTSFPKVKTAKKPKTYTTMKPNQTEGSTPEEKFDPFLICGPNKEDRTHGTRQRLKDKIEKLKQAKAMTDNQDVPKEGSTGVENESNTSKVLRKFMVRVNELSEHNAACLAALKELIPIAEAYTKIIENEWFGEPRKEIVEAAIERAKKLAP